MQPFEIKSICLVVAIYVSGQVNYVETTNGLCCQLTSSENVPEI